MASSLQSALNHFLNSPQWLAFEMKFLVYLTAALFLVHVVCSPHRRRSSNSHVQLITWFACTVTWSMAIYAIGMLHKPSFPVDRTLVGAWAVSLLMMMGSGYTTMAYHLDDNKRWKEPLLTLFIYSAYTYVIVASNGSFRTKLFEICLAVVAYMTNWHGMLARRETSTWASSKFLGDYMKEYMKREDTSSKFLRLEDYMKEYEKREDPSSVDYDATTLQGFRYLVQLPSNIAIDAEKTDGDAAALMYNYTLRAVANDGRVTLEDIWWTRSELLQSEEGKRWKDVCLSYALFLLLLRRFHGIPCAEAGGQQPRHLVLEGMLRNGGYRRAFEVVEVQLAFLYDYFYTKYAYLKANTRLMFSCVALKMILILLLVASVLLDNRSFARAARDRTSADVVITVALLGVLFALESLQVLLYFTSNWYVVNFVCDYVRKPSGCHIGRWVVEQSSRVHSLKSWQHKLSQRSLLDMGGVSSKPFLERLWGRFLMLCTMFFDQHSSWDTKISRWELFFLKRTEVPFGEEVKEAIARALVALLDNEGLLTNGVWSVIQNGFIRQLGWACSDLVHSVLSPLFFTGREDPFPDEAKNILIWHIATCYCEAAPAAGGETKEAKVHRRVAAQLSKYFLYLVADLPQLLPDHFTDTAHIFTRVVMEALHYLKGATTTSQRYAKMKELLPEESPRTVFETGVKLGKQLEMIDDAELRWKVMAEFWAEKMLYVAPSDNVKDHIERLAHGGELVTHLWALLANAGIYAREPDLVEIRES